MKDKKTKIAIISIVALLLVLIGVTYAYWLVTKTQTNSNLVSSACLDITLDNESNDIRLSSQYPMSDEEGMKLTPYTFTVTNNCNTSIDYQVALESIGDEVNAINMNALQVALDDSADLLSNRASVSSTVSGAYASHKLVMGTLTASGSEGSSVTHSLRIWIDENAPISEANKTYQSKITVTIGQGIENFKLLGETIITHATANNYLYTTTPNFAATTNEGEHGLYSISDDLGESYYFRGDVTNNYVQFGKYADDAAVYTINNLDTCWGGICVYSSLEECESASWRDYDGDLSTCVETASADAGKDMYWRIVRVNGDGTIRLVYDGTTKVENGTTHSATIGNTAYNAEGFLNVNYGDSDIKGVVDTWYSAHLKTNYESYIADGIFCNDKEVIKAYYWDENGEGTTKENAYFIDVNYAPYTRLDTSIPSPTLKCTREEDRYTTNKNIGNGLLTHPVGLLTADEAFFAGGTTQNNNTYYLYSGDEFWTSSPYYSYSYVAYAHVWHVSMAVGVSDADNLGYISGIRPVINLSADVEFTGDGSFETPYVIKTN